MEQRCHLSPAQESPWTGEDRRALTQLSVLSSFLWDLGLFLWFPNSKEECETPTSDEKSLGKVLQTRNAAKEDPGELG